MKKRNIIARGSGERAESVADLCCETKEGWGVWTYPECARRWESRYVSKSKKSRAEKGPGKKFCQKKLVSVCEPRKVIEFATADQGKKNSRKKRDLREEEPPLSNQKRGSSHVAKGIVRSEC